MKRFAMIGAVLLAGTAQGRAGSPTPDSRADELIKQMTLEEKILMLGGDRDAFSTHAIDRLGIPKLVMADGPQGVRNYGQACSFPCGSALAATWDIALAQRYGQAMGLEGRARGVHIQLGPAMNICRQAINGRNFEYFGEDPFLAGNIAAQWVRGLQGEGVIATIKHFACNNQEWNRGSVDVIVDERALHEIYLPAFHRAVTEGGAWAVMCAYNRLNGAYCSENNWLLEKTLKKEWGFKGLVMSDWGAVHSPAVLANGLDLEMPNAKYLTETNVKAELQAGRLTEKQIDDAVRRILRAAIAMGFLDNKSQKRGDLALDSADSDKVALDVARGAMVLLKNEKNALPLDRTSVKTVAVYGARATRTILGGGGSGTVNPFKRVNFLDGITAVAGSNVKIVPVPPPEGADFETFPIAFIKANGDAGLNLSVDVQWKKVDSASAVVPGVNLQWEKGKLPRDITGDSSAVYRWSGFLIAQEDSEWETIRHGNVDINIGSQAIPEDGDTFMLKKGEPVPIRISTRVNAAGGPGKVQVSIRPAALPDLTAARNADAVVICVGRYEEEGRDRSFELPVAQQKLITAIAAVNPRTIVVNNSGAGVDMAPWNDKAQAIVQAWFPGQEGGTALGEILFGDVNPSGHLPMTFDRALTDNEAMNNYPGKTLQDKKWPEVHYEEGIFVGYRGYDRTGKTPLYPFGYGLSYTSFKYTNLVVNKSGAGAKASLDLTNEGKRDGAAVVQIYVGQPKCSVERPLRELKGFAKVMLKAGEMKHVEVDLPKDSFAFWSPAKKDWTVEPGSFVIEAGASERDIRLQSTFQAGAAHE